MIAETLLPCVGIAILLRNLSLHEYPEAFYVGIVVAAFFALINQSQMILLVVMLMAVSLGLYDFHKNNTVTVEKDVKGGGKKWW